MFTHADRCAMVSVSLIVLALQGCLDGTVPTNNGEIDNDDTDHSTLLATVSDNVIIPAYARFAETTAAWTEDNNAISDYCRVIGESSENTSLATAQQSWRDAMDEWQQIEAFQIGPITDNSNNLRQRVYSWPDFISTCTIDQNVVRAESSLDFDSVARQGRGLDALEYLLFNSELTHSCPSQITETQDWDARTENDRKQARCQYAELVAADIATSAQTLLSAWQAEGGNYRQSLIDSGSEGGAFESQTAALNALSDSLFYLDDWVKDAKLALPTGLSASCDSTTCPEAMEAQYGDHSLATIKYNLVGFKDIFTGTADEESRNFSFDDLLFTKNFPEISDRVIENVDAALALIDEIPVSFSEGIDAIENAADDSACINAANNPDAASELHLCRLHGHIKRITDELKGDFLTVISLNLPSRVEGDND